MATAPLYRGVYAFDVDDTLLLPNAPFPGPVKLEDILLLRNEGYVTGICGNFTVLFKVYPRWYQLFSFYGPVKLLTGMPGGGPAHHQYKHFQLIDVKTDLPAEKYVMVGNKRGDPKARPGSQDDVQAKLAGFKFLTETEFASGKR